MPITRTQKDEKIADLTEKFGNVESVFLADLTGMSVEVVTKFRRRCREKDVDVEVVKNTLLARAVRGTEFEPLAPHLGGPTALMTSATDAVAPARVLIDFIRANRLPKVKVACLEGVVYDDQGVKQLSQLPTHDELLSMLLRSLQGPLTNLVSVLSGNARNLARVLGEVAKQKGE